jgi:hypothetical protein
MEKLQLEHGGAKLEIRRGRLASGLEGKVVHVGNWKTVAARRRIEAVGPRHGDSAKKERRDLLALTVSHLEVDKLQAPMRVRRRSYNRTDQLYKIN